MIEQFERQKEVEDEERAIQLKRQEDDHKRQLEELKRSNAEQLAEIEATKRKELETLRREHAKQLQEIEEAKQEELQAFNEANQESLAATQQHGSDSLKIQEDGQEQSLDSHREYWNEVNKIASDAVSDIGGNVKNDPNLKKPKVTLTDPQGNPIGGFAGGGFNFRTGLAALHGTAGRPEFVANANTTAGLRAMLGNNFSQAQLLNAVASGGNGAVNASFTINAAPGQSPEMIARVVENRMAKLFRDMGPS
jgi:hypothetical protein